MPYPVVDGCARRRRCHGASPAGLGQDAAPRSSRRHRRGRRRCPSVSRQPPPADDQSAHDGLQHAAQPAASCRPERGDQVHLRDTYRVGKVRLRILAPSRTQAAILRVIPPVTVSSQCHPILLVWESSAAKAESFSMAMDSYPGRIVRAGEERVQPDWRDPSTASAGPHSGHSWQRRPSLCHRAGWVIRWWAVNTRYVLHNKSSSPCDPAPWISRAG